ncbi:MAG: hypothetical protein LBB60_11270 [Desulfovibrio sp.]|jgi:mRNA-degrading endonuclease RelE of RelBE toxin-antitoxin system|nr:hypothetical protein [Desulfovibrio sp.]
MEVRISTNATRQLRKLPASARDAINNAVAAAQLIELYDGEPANAPSGSEPA